MHLLAGVLIVIAGLGFILGRLVFRNELDEGKRFWKGFLLAMGLTVASAVVGIKYFLDREDRKEKRIYCKGHQGLTVEDVTGKWQGPVSFFQLAADGSLQAKEFNGEAHDGKWRIEGSMLFLDFADGIPGLAYRICDCEGDEMCIRLHGEDENTVIQRIE